MGYANMIDKLAGFVKPGGKTGSEPVKGISIQEDEI